jgi:hypothetical protein
MNQLSAFSYQLILLKLHLASALDPPLRTKKAEG